MDDEILLERTLPSQPESVVEAVAFAERVARSSMLAEETSERLVLAIAEAVANAIEHGNQSVPERQVRIRWEGGEGEGWLLVEDEGKGIAAARLTDATLPDDLYQTGGRGLYIMNKLCDDARIEGAQIWLRFEPRADSDA